MAVNTIDKVQFLSFIIINSYKLCVLQQSSTSSQPGTPVAACTLECKTEDERNADCSA